MWFKRILKQQDLLESAESPIRCLWIQTALFILISTFIGLTTLELLIFQQCTKINWIFHVAFSRDTGLYSFFSILCRNLPAAVPLAVVFLEAGICGIVVHHSHSLHSVRQLHNSPLAQPLVVWPHWGDTRSPHQSHSSWHPRHAFGSSGLLINGCHHVTTCQATYLQRGKTNQCAVFFHALLLPRIACKNPSSFLTVAQYNTSIDKLLQTHGSEQK